MERIEGGSTWFHLGVHRSPINDQRERDPSLPSLSSIRSAISIYGSSLSATIQIDKETQTRTPLAGRPVLYLSLTGMTIEQSSLGAGNPRFSLAENRGIIWARRSWTVNGLETQWRLEAVRRRLIVYFSTPSRPEVVLASLQRADSRGFTLILQRRAFATFRRKSLENICLAPGKRWLLETGISAVSDNPRSRKSLSWKGFLKRLFQLSTRATVEKYSERLFEYSPRLCVTSIDSSFSTEKYISRCISRYTSTVRQRFA